MGRGQGVAIGSSGDSVGKAKGPAKGWDRLGAGQNAVDEASMDAQPPGSVRRMVRQYAKYGTAAPVLAARFLDDGHVPHVPADVSLTRLTLAQVRSTVTRALRADPETDFVPVLPLTANSGDVVPLTAYAEAISFRHTLACMVM